VVVGLVVEDGQLLLCEKVVLVAVAVLYQEWFFQLLCLALLKQ
jgi:hypothetical protein